MCQSFVLSAVHQQLQLCSHQPSNVTVNVNVDNKIAQGQISSRSKVAEI